MKDWAIFILSLIVVGAFFAGSFKILFDPLPIKDREIFDLVYGSVNVLTGIVMNYWFGTSRSSADKDKTIVTLTANQKP